MANLVLELYSPSGNDVEKLQKESSSLRLGFIGKVNSQFKKINFSFLFELSDLRKIYVLNLKTGCPKKCFM